MKKYRYTLISGDRIYPDDIEQFIVRTEGEKSFIDLLKSGQPFEYEIRDARTGGYRSGYSIPPEWQVDIWGHHFHFPYPEAKGKELSQEELKEYLKGMEASNRRKEEGLKSFLGL